MKCLETEKLIGYAYRLLDESAASRVRAHLGDCPRCREIVEQHGRLDAVLSEWKTEEPSPEFDARVRLAVEAQKFGSNARAFWHWQWARGLALASLAVLIIAGLVWFARGHLGVSDSSRVAEQKPRQATSAQAPAQVANLHSLAVPGDGSLRPVQAVHGNKSAVGFTNEDKVTQALEDYDLAANFDLLSELPKGEPRVAN